MVVLGACGERQAQELAALQSREASKRLLFSVLVHWRKGVADAEPRARWRDKNYRGMVEARAWILDPLGRCLYPAVVGLNGCVEEVGREEAVAQKVGKDTEDNEGYGIVGAGNGRRRRLVEVEDSMRRSGGSAASLPGCQARCQEDRHDVLAEHSHVEVEDKDTQRRPAEVVRKGTGM
jgi:hypothetical protein